VQIQIKGVNLQTSLMKKCHYCDIDYGDYVKHLETKHVTDWANKRSNPERTFSTHTEKSY